MTAQRDRGVAVIFAVLGALLFGLAAVLDLVRGAVDVAQHGAARVPFVFGQAVVFVVLAVVVGVFALLGRPARSERSVVSGAVLVVLALVGWLALGAATSLVALVATVLTLVGGVVFLVAGR